MDNAIWSVNLLSELQFGLYGEHCSDVLVRVHETGAVLSGHNEDWTKDWTPYLYWVVYNTMPGATFRSVGGLCYPGQAPGFAVTFTRSVLTICLLMGQPHN